MSWLVDPATRVLTTAMSGFALREQAIAANMANIDTPGYHAVTTDFEDELAAALDEAAGTTLAMNAPTDGPSAAAGLRAGAGTGLQGMATGGAAAGGPALDRQADGVAHRMDGNGVDVESEMTALAETQLKYSAVSRMLNGKLGMLRDVVQAR